ncbi:MAG: Poly(3-hydroxybutyrate) depolymerase-like protein [Xanthobacteraceae bacterium]|jgi:polyhydroxybutyrate depolymerase|nr:Poly(3-hydroxybutyrate) depolymerase-like protein [Xanthobacteraceae bacterium]
MRLSKIRLLLSALLLMGCVVVTTVMLSALTAPASAQERSIAVGNLTREFILHTPQNAGPGPWPLVIALHGAWQPAGALRSYLDLDAIAEREGFAVAYPKGINLLWNDGRGSVAGIMPIIHKRDDAAFILGVLDTLVAEGIADPGRAYLMGFSNGGFLTAFIACRHAERFAAYATLMMTAPVSYAQSCRPSRPIPILLMNGTYDPIVPMFGRPTPGARLMSATESAQFFARIDGCGEPVQEPAKNARIVRWNDCAGGSAVAFYQVEGGHQPPASSVSGTDMLASLLLGPRRRGLDAPEEIWTFFRRFGAWPQTIDGNPGVSVGLPMPAGAAAALNGIVPGAGPVPGSTSASAFAPAEVPLPIPSPLRRRPTALQ